MIPDGEVFDIFTRPPLALRASPSAWANKIFHTYLKFLQFNRRRPSRSFVRLFIHPTS